MLLHTRTRQTYTSLTSPCLGVELGDHLNWKEHTERARSNGVRMLNMVRRNFTRGTTPMIRCEINNSLEYGSIVWDPHQHTIIKTLEAVQNKVARYVNQDWDIYKSVITMNKDLGWLTLQERRLINRLTFLKFQLSHQMVVISVFFSLQEYQPHVKAY